MILHNGDTREATRDLARITRNEKAPRHPPFLLPRSESFLLLLLLYCYHRRMTMVALPYHTNDDAMLVC